MAKLNMQASASSAAIRGGGEQFNKNGHFSLHEEDSPQRAAGRFNNDTFAGLLLLAFSLIHIFYLTPTQVELHRGDTLLALSPRLFCYITGGLLGGLSVILIYLSFRKNGQTKTVAASTTSWQPLMRGLFSTAMACVYVALAHYLGFFFSTALAMTVFLIYFGVKRWFGILLFLFVVLGFIYLLFVQALKVVMPDGLLF